MAYIARIGLFAACLASTWLGAGRAAAEPPAAPPGPATAVQPVQPEQPQQPLQPARPEPIAASPPSAGAPPRAPLSGPIDLPTAVNYAVANNPRIQAARYEARALGARVPQARSLPDPQLTATAFLEEIQTAAGPQEVALRLSQKFPWFGKLALRSQVAYQAAMAAYARAAAVELEVIEDVNLAYYDLWFLQAATDEIRRLKPRLTDVIGIAKTRYETNAPGAGLESVYQVQIELSKLDVRLVELAEARDRAEARLVAALHLPAQTRLEAAARPLDSKGLQTVDVLVGLVDVCQPELEAWRREIERDRSSIRLAERDYWPDVTLGLNWYEMGDEGISPVANGRDAFSLGVGANLPIYRKRLDAAVREARYNTASAARRYASARDRFQAEIRSLYARFREHDRMLEILRKQIVPKAADSLELSTESYRTGRQDFQQLIDVYRTLLNYRVDMHRQSAEREKAVASLERAVGCSVFGRAERPPQQPIGAPVGPAPAPPLPE
jgi:outer membrane protein TolC